MRGAFGILATLCAMMVLWILGLPATWRAGWAWHDRLVAAWYERSIQTLGHFPTPLNLITKYKGHSVAQLCHTLPGALWAALIPFQLHPVARRRFVYTRAPRGLRVHGVGVPDDGRVRIH